MNSLFTVVLHAGAVYEITFLEYLLRVGIYSLVLGGIGGIVYWGLEAISVDCSGVGENPDGRRNDP